MSTVKADTVQPKDFASDLTLGASGDTVTVAANSINVNKVQDKGGNTLWDYSTGEFVAGNKAFGSQNLKLLSTANATGVTSISFASQIDSTYDVYVFKFININPSTEGSSVRFTFNGSIDGTSTFEVTKTTTYFWALNNASSTSLEYSAGDDLAQETGYQFIADGLGSDADEGASGELYLFAPSSTTYVKHFYSTVQFAEYGGYAINGFPAGYFNTLSAINAIDFKISSGNFDGTIKMYGLL